LRTFELRPIAPFADIRRRFEGRAARPCDFDVIVDGDARCLDAVTGRLVFLFRKGVIAPQDSRLARESYGDIDGIEPASVTRRAAAGLIDSEKFGVLRDDVVGVIPISATTGHLKLASGKVLRQPVSNPVHSYLAGYSFSRFGRRNMLGRITSRYPERWTASLPFFQRIDTVFARELPEVHELHVNRCLLHPQWRIPGTALSTVTINVNYESHYHLDRGDFRQGYSALSVVEMDRYRGGLFVFPSYRIAVDVRESDLMFCQSHIDFHGNTQVVKESPMAKRLSFVTYLKHKLAEGVNREEDPQESQTRCASSPDSAAV
jgi:hypothetical protein